MGLFSVASAQVAGAYLIEAFGMFVHAIGSSYEQITEFCRGNDGVFANLSKPNVHRIGTLQSLGDFVGVLAFAMPHQCPQAHKGGTVAVATEQYEHRFIWLSVGVAIELTGIIFAPHRPHSAAIFSAAVLAWASAQALEPGPA
jgi:hypothetical protein